MLASLTLLPLGIADASIALHSLNRNVKLLNVKSANGGSVLAPYQITRGTLPSIAYAKGAGDVTSRGDFLAIVSYHSSTER